MNNTNNDLSIVLRPHPLTTAFWFFVSGGLLVLFLVVSPLINPPGWVRFFFFAMPTLGLLVGLVLSFASVRVTPDGVANRYLRRWFVRWDDVEAWSQLAPGGSVYLRTCEGRIVGFSSWCVYGVRCDRLAKVLEQRLGPRATGEAIVAPWPFRRLVG